MSREISTYWVTNRALTRGVLCAEGSPTTWGIELTDESRARVGSWHVQPQHVHETRAEAVAAAEAMRARRLASLEKQIAKIEALNFEVAS